MASARHSDINGGWYSVHNTMFSQAGVSSVASLVGVTTQWSIIRACDRVDRASLYYATRIIDRLCVAVSIDYARIQNHLIIRGL